MKIGYARAAAGGPSLDVQTHELKAAGCTQIFQENKSGATRWNRPQLESAFLELERLCPECRNFDDYCADVALCGTCRGERAKRTLVVTKLDRLARSTSDLLWVLERIRKAGASFLSLSEPWADTTSPAGQHKMEALAGVAQFEREWMMERCGTGRKLAVEQGARLGRRPKLSIHQQREIMQRLKNGESAKMLARSYRVHRATIYRLQRAKSPA